ncbi:Uncharacterised protein [Mycobacteroides abscessus subsp. abscessus]|nr:Uncharacterised protein [Mycobacteroides abscessus subsp. abscessus]
MDLCPLEELVVGDHAIELGVGNEVIVAAVDLAGARRARRGGDAEEQGWHELADSSHDGRLTHGRGADQNNQSAPRVCVLPAQDGNFSSSALR